MERKSFHDQRFWTEGVKLRISFVSKQGPAREKCKTGVKRFNQNVTFQDLSFDAQVLFVDVRFRVFLRTLVWIDDGGGEKGKPRPNLYWEKIKRLT